MAFSLDELNTTLIQRNNETAEKLESKWWFPIKYDFKPKLSQDYKEDFAGRGERAQQKISRWFRTHKVFWIPLLITTVVVAAVLVKLGTYENILPFVFLGFPFVIIFFGIIYAIGLVIKDS